MSLTDVYLVVPTIRDLAFFAEWGNAFQGCHLLIVEDREKKTVTLPHQNFRSITHVCWKDIEADFGNDEWIFSRHNAGIRSYGFWKAWKAKADVVITLDDDCYPVGDSSTFVRQHLDNLSFSAPEKWFATYPDPQWMFTRGFPYGAREKFPVKVSHGIWSGALDLDGKTEIQLPSLLVEKPYPPIRQVIPFGYYYPMCSMNLAFHRDVIPLMFFPMMGQDHRGRNWGFDRYDDIWAGIFSKKIMDHLGWGVVCGSPQVEHRKKSLPTMNHDKEKDALMVNERLWMDLDVTTLTDDNPMTCYRQLIETINFPQGEYFIKLRHAMRIWLSKFD
jgi:hypothetical protein